jgi:hypothetical protein
LRTPRPSTMVTLREAMNVAISLSPLLDGKLQRRTPSLSHKSIGWKLGSFIRPSVATSAQTEITTASNIPDGPDAAFATVQVNKATISGVVESVENGVDEQNFPVLQMILRLSNENAPMFVRTRVSAEEVAAQVLTKKESRRQKKCKTQQQLIRPVSSAVEAREFATQFVGKEVLVEGSLRLRPQVDDTTGVAHYVPVLVIPEGELLIALSSR